MFYLVMISQPLVPELLHDEFLLESAENSESIGVDRTTLVFALWLVCVSRAVNRLCSLSFSSCVFFCSSDAAVFCRGVLSHLSHPFGPSLCFREFFFPSNLANFANFDCLACFFRFLRVLPLFLLILPRFLLILFTYRACFAYFAHIWSFCPVGC